MNGHVVTPVWNHGIEQASDLLTRLFRGFDGKLALRLWDGTALRLGKAVQDGTADASLHGRSVKAHSNAERREQDSSP